MLVYNNVTFTQKSVIELKGIILDKHTFKHTTRILQKCTFLLDYRSDLLRQIASGQTYL